MENNETNKKLPVSIEDWTKFGDALMENGDRIYEEYFQLLRPKPGSSLVERLVPAMDHYNRNFFFYQEPFNEQVFESTLRAIIGPNLEKI